MWTFSYTWFILLDDIDVGLFQPLESTDEFLLEFLIDLSNKINADDIGVGLFQSVKTEYEAEPEIVVTADEKLKSTNEFLSEFVTDLSNKMNADDFDVALVHSAKRTMTKYKAIPQVDKSLEELLSEFEIFLLNISLKNIGVL